MIGEVLVCVGDGVCEACGKPLPAFARRCPAKTAKDDGPRKPGLGDRLESALTKLGITQEKWVAWKEAHGLPPTCGCDARREWLNQFGETFGKPAAALVRLVLRGV